jgi:hypothetical protein
VRRREEVEGRGEDEKWDGRKSGRRRERRGHTA